MIIAGKVQVNGRTVRQLGLQVDSDRDVITVQGETIRPSARRVYLLLNKPVGYVVTMSDPQGRPVVHELLKGIRDRVFPVGRLDIDVEGLLILTNDGLLANCLAHPRHMVEKVYDIQVQGKPSQKTLRAVEKGLPLADGLTAPVVLTVISSDGETTHLRQAMHEGRKRQVKRMWAEVGHPVLRLRRIGYAGLNLRGLKPGQWRALTSREIERLRRQVGLS